jgi:hypothetical protein
MLKMACSSLTTVDGWSSASEQALEFTHEDTSAALVDELRKWF